MPDRRNSSARWLAGTAGVVTLAAAAVFIGSAQLPTTAATPPEVFAGFDDLSGLSSVGQNVHKLDVPAGSYVVTAKAFVDNPGSQAATVTCQLKGDVVRDQTTVKVNPGGSESLALNAVFALTGQDLLLLCKSSSNSPDLHWAKLIATRVKAISDVEI